VFRRLTDIPGEIDLVDVFRRAEDIPAHLKRPSACLVPVRNME
jgi:predicted CoA-binding protein